MELPICTVVTSLALPSWNGPSSLSDMENTGIGSYIDAWTKLKKNGISKINANKKKPNSKDNSYFNSIHQLVMYEVAWLKLF